MNGKYKDGGNLDLDKVVVRRIDGSRITEAEAEALGEKIAQKARGGRPSLSGEAAASPRIVLRVSEQTRDQLLQRAEAEGKTISQIAREALEAYIA